MQLVLNLSRHDSNDKGIETHHSDDIKHAIFNKCFAQAIIITPPMLGIAITNCAEYPREIDSGAAT